MTHPNDKIQLIHATEAQGDYSGLTKREYFAAMAMQGYTSAGSTGMPDPERLAEYAVALADLLIKELNK